MAGFMDMLGKKPETESSSSYQRTVLREVARKLGDLEEQNEQNAMAIEEVRKLTRSMLQRLDTMKADREVVSDSRMAPTSVPARVEGIDELQRQVEALAQRLTTGAGNLETELAGVAGKLEAVEAQLEQLREQQSQETEQDADEGEVPVQEQLDTLRLSLEDTVHKENIKCFRNIQGALEEQGDGRSYDLKALRKYLKVIVWFQLVTIALIVLRILGFL